MHILANFRIFYSQKKNEKEMCAFSYQIIDYVSTRLVYGKNLALHEFFWLMFAIKFLNMKKN